MIIFEGNDSLVEAFSRPVKYDWLNNDDIYFEVGGVSYRADLRTKTDSQGQNMDISFQYRDTSGQWTHRLKKGSDTKDALAVLATVLAAAEEKIRKTKPDVVTFSAFTDDDDKDARKRFNLYRRMAERYAKKLDYTMNVIDRLFILKNNNPVEVRRLPNDGIQEDDGLFYVEFPKCNMFTWATLFDVKNPGEVEMTSLPNGFAMVKLVNDKTFRIKTSFGDTLDMPEVWEKLLGTIWTETPWGGDGKSKMYERGALLDDGRMLILDGRTLFIVKNTDEFNEIWGHTFVEITK